MLQMATYPGMNLGGEVRESISLDEDDLSDVEDEVFIRDGKNSYKLAEELNVKRPLMAPRRKHAKPGLTNRFRSRPPCRVLCRPCCYIFAALALLLALIAATVVLVSIFPLPLDRLRLWFAPPPPPARLRPCAGLGVRTLWATALPALSSDSPVRTLDADLDGVPDAIFGFGAARADLPAAVFCPIFLGVAPPCGGGVVALSGASGALLWRHWLNDTVFNVECSSDLNGDRLPDCLASGVGGALVALDARNGSVIWARSGGRGEVFVAGLVRDVDNDTIDDVLSAHAPLSDGGGGGHVVLLSGRSGEEVRRFELPQGVRTFAMPEVLKGNGSEWVIYGSGGPESSGNLSVVELDGFSTGNWTSKTIYEDRFKGVFTQSVLIDITSDGILDIVTAMFNSTVVAFNGANFTQIWNYTIPNAETNVTPTPAFFNSDKIPDFLITYQKFDNIINYNYTETYILDGKTGKPIYTKSIGNSVATQLGGLTISMEVPGFDFFVFWTSECRNVDIYKNNGDFKTNRSSNEDLCRAQFNSSTIVKLFALNQFDQPPGLEIYNSFNKSDIEFNNTKSPMKLLRDYIKHSKIPITNEGQAELDEPYLNQQKNEKIAVHKYGSSFRHKDNRPEIGKDFEIPAPLSPNEPVESDFYQANILDNLQGDLGQDFNNYNDEETQIFPQKPEMYVNSASTSQEHRNRPKFAESSSRKKNLGQQAPGSGVYDYKNVEAAKHRLMYDLDSQPTDILRDAYEQNRENSESHSKFEQRDVRERLARIRDSKEKALTDEVKNKLTLWDLESEKESSEKNNESRSKRQVKMSENVLRQVSSVGAIVDSFNTSRNTIDLIFITSWQPIAGQNRDLDDCVEEKLTNASEDEVHSYQKITEAEKRRLFMNECRKEEQDLKNDFVYFNQVAQLQFGQITVYRLRIECLCAVKDEKTERCAKFLPEKDQTWPMYLGRLGNGVFGNYN